MKILIIAFTFHPNKDGVSEAAAAMALGFARHGWKVEVLTEVTNPIRNSLNWSGATIHEFEYSNSGILIHGDKPDYFEFLRSKQWDVVIFHSYTTELYLALPWLQKMPFKKILVSHGYGALIWQPVNQFPFYGLGQWFRAVVKSLYMPCWLKRLDRVVYLSESADFRAFYDHSIAKVIGHDGIRCIPNGVNPSERGTNPSEFRRQHGISDDAFLFLCVANYSARKDQGYAARAFRKAAIPGSVLVFIGSHFNVHSEKFMHEDKRALKFASGETIIWLAQQTRAATLNALAGCNAFVLSAYHEAQPIALLEAMRESKPWIARDAGCISEIPGGLCVHSESEMAASMIQLAADPILQARLGSEGAHAVATKYNRATYVESYCKLIEELTSDL